MFNNSYFISHAYSKSLKLIHRITLYTDTRFQMWSHLESSSNPINMVVRFIALWKKVASVISTYNETLASLTKFLFSS
jgi:hypothetical protein